MADTTKSPDSPTTVRLGSGQVTALDLIKDKVKLTRNSLINLAIDAFIDHVERTGKLPVPNLKRGKRGGRNG